MVGQGRAVDGIEALMWLVDCRFVCVIGIGGSGEGGKRAPWVEKG